MDNEESKTYLTSLINKSLRISTTDLRVFHGQFKCTDPDRNIILTQTYEYRPPSHRQKLEAAAAVEGGGLTVKLDMTSRYLGLVVIPGQHICKVELEEFASQLKKTTSNSNNKAATRSGSSLGKRVEEGEAQLLARRRAEGGV